MMSVVRKYLAGLILLAGLVGFVGCESDEHHHHQGGTDSGYYYQHEDQRGHPYNEYNNY
jgi:hypothetical protein